MTIQGASPDLYNEDLAPAKVRNWGPFSIFNVWTSDVHSLWGYYLAASYAGVKTLSTNHLGQSAHRVPVARGADTQALVAGRRN